MFRKTSWQEYEYLAFIYV